MESKGFLSFLLLIAVVWVATAHSVKIPINSYDINIQQHNSFGNRSQLQQLANRIVQARALSASVLGNETSLWHYLWKGLSLNSTYDAELSINVSFALDGITVKIITQNGQDELIVQATADMWGHPNTPIQITFFYASNGDLDLCLIFGITGLIELPYSIMPNNTDSNPNVTDWYKGVNFVGPNTLAIATTTFTDLDGTTYNRGLTITTTVEAVDVPIQQDLRQFIYGPNGNGPIKGTIIASFPIDPNDPLATFSLMFDEPINFFNADVQAKNLELILTVDMSPNVVLKTTIYVELTGQTLIFDCTATVTLSQGLVFVGNLQNSPWKDAFGMSWFTLNDLTVTFQLDVTGLFGKLTMDGNAALSFQNQPPVHVTFDVTLNEEGLSSFLVLQTTIVGTVDLFDDILGVVPPNANQIKMTGQTQLALSTTNGQYRQGLTINGNAQIGGSGDLASTAAAITSYSKQQLNYVFYLFVPVFSSSPEDILFRLSETDPVPFADNAVMENIEFQFSVQPNPQVLLSTNLAITFDHESTPHIFSMTATVSSQMLTFNGAMQGVWEHPFGLDWLQLSDITVDMAYNVQQQKLTTFNVNANYNASIVLSTDPTVQIQFYGNLHQFTFQLSVYITDAQMFFNGVLPSNIAPPLTSEMSIAASLIISDFNSGSSVDGITVMGEAMISPSGTLGTAIRSLDPQAQLSFGCQIGIPIWGSGLPLVVFDYQETGTVNLASNVVLTGFDLHFEISPNPAIDLKSQGTITFNENSGSLTFDLSADLDESQFSMSGNLVGIWNKPFGLPWLHFQNVQIDMGFDNFDLTSISISGTAVLDFAADGQTVQVTISTSPSFEDIMFEAQAVGIVDLAAVIQDIFGSVPAELQDLTSVNNKINVIVATYSTSQFQAGITIQDEFVVTGSLLQTLKVFNRNSAPSMYFQGSLSIPVYESIPDIAVSLSTNIPIVVNSEAQFTQLTVAFSLAPLTISVSANFEITFRNNPTLSFTVTGSLSSDGVIAFNGVMNGVWNNMFGYADFSATNVDIDLGLNPALCGVDLCIAQLGLGYNIAIGSTTVAFYGLINVPDLLDIFIEAHIHKGNQMALSFQDVALGYNTLVAGRLPNLNPSQYPSTWGLRNLDFYLAPESGTFDGIYYTPGFYMIGSFVLLGVDCSVNTSISDNGFYFHVNYSVDTFSQMINNQLGARMRAHPEEFPSWPEDVKQAFLSGSNTMPGSETVIVKVTNVSLANVACYRFAYGMDSSFNMDYILFGNNEQASFGVDVVALYSDFEYFFQNYLANLFS